MNNAGCRYVALTEDVDPATSLVVVTEFRPARPDDEQALLAVHLATWTSQVSPDGAPIRRSRSSTEVPHWQMSSS